jgi:peptidoglycan/LPS O-acetylase OafA/YrhL
VDDQERIEALDGIRGVAVALVLAYHCFYGWPRGGFIGVDLFFVLSGFLITRLLVAERKRLGRISLPDFYWRRLRRLAPPLILAIVLSAAIKWMVPAYQRGVPLPLAAAATLMYVGNVLHIHGLGILGHTWSLSIEEQFYLVWPAALGLLLRWQRRSTAYGIVLALAALSFILAATTSASNFEARYDATLPRVGEILIGVLLALGLRSDTALAERLRPLVSFMLAALAFATISIAGLVLPRSPVMFQGPLLVTCLAAAVLIGHCAVHSSPLTRVLSSAPIAYVGRVSYGLYLYHFPLTVLFDHNRFGLTGFTQAMARVICAGVLAVASYHFVEAPLRRLNRPRWGVNPLPEQTGPSIRES